MKTDAHVEKLIEKHMQSKLNDQEFQELEEWVTASEENMQLFLTLTDQYFVAGQTNEGNQVGSKGDRKTLPVTSSNRVRYAVITIIVLLAIGGGYWWFSLKPELKVLAAIKQLSITTAAGQQLHYTLPDGSVVWLNAGSTIRFPATFDKELRSVELIGEAYFDITKLPMADGRNNVPFIVHTKPGDIEVTGTHFNVKAYENEPLKTTLLEGAIKLRHGNKVQPVKPGEEAILDASGAFSVNKLTDSTLLNAAVAWKNKYFDFQNTPLKEIMAEVSRWYDMKVEWKDTIDKPFSTGGPRSIKLRDFLDLIERTKYAHFDIDTTQRIITVRK